jgi:hypothetical protein
MKQKRYGSHGTVPRSKIAYFCDFAGVAKTATTRRLFLVFFLNRPR